MRRKWRKRELDELPTNLSSQIESNGSLATEVVTTDKELDLLVAGIREVALAAGSVHITFRLGQANSIVFLMI